MILYLAVCAMICAVINSYRGEVAATSVMVAACFLLCALAHIQQTIEGRR